MHACVRACLNVCVHASCVRACVRACVMCACVCACMHVCMCACMRACVRACVLACNRHSQQRSPKKSEECSERVSCVIATRSMIRRSSMKPPARSTQRSLAARHCATLARFAVISSVRMGGFSTCSVEGCLNLMYKQNT